MALSPKTLNDLGWPSLQAELERRSHTSAGARLAAVLMPLGDAGAARRRVAEVAEARLLRQLDEPLVFGGIEDVAEAVALARKGGVLEPRDLIAIGDTLVGASRMRRHLTGRRDSCPLLAATAERLAELTHIAGPIRDSFDDNGRLADHASPSLRGLRKRAAGLKDELMGRIASLLADPAIAPTLSDNFYTQREDRFVLPVKAAVRAQVRGIVHGTSQSGATVFIEPEAVVNLNNSLKLAELEVADEERRILTELTGYVREDADLVVVDLEVLADLDLVDTCAALADAEGATAPEIVDPADGGLAVESARHPLMLLAGRECVSNRLEVPPGGALVISGPNAGGKTVALKTAGILVLMAESGLHVPAGPGSRLPFYRTVLSDMGDEQSLERNLSTFSAHVLNLVAFLAQAGPDALVLLDEIAVGTDPAQGAALAEAVLQAFADRGATVLVTTHYERLKALPPRDPRFVNASVGFDLEALAPTYKLHLGVPGSSGAITVARRLGLDPAVAARAEELLGPREAGIEQLLRTLSDERRRLELERAAAKLELERQRAATEEAERRAQALAVREHDLKMRGHTEAVAALRRARDEIEAARKLLRRGPDPARVEQAQRMVQEASEAVAAQAPAPDRPPGRPARPEELHVGVRVYVPRLGGTGTVAAPADRGRVTVLVGALRTQVAVGELLIPDGTGGGPAPDGRHARRVDAAVKRRVATVAGFGAPRAAELAAAAAAAAPVAAGPTRTIDNTLDLRGERVDDALRLADEFLDRALRADRAVVFLVHGHGTGALRNALREHLATHAVVTAARPGELSEGGDGVTVVQLD
ncbi:MAG TPA: Smr/MutS family protein [Polyangia bacterium]